MHGHIVDALVEELIEIEGVVSQELERRKLSLHYSLLSSTWQNVDIEGHAKQFILVLMEFEGGYAYLQWHEVSHVLPVFPVSQLHTI